MTVRVAYDNLVDGASAIAASSEASGFPVENVQDERLAKKWRTTGAAAAETVTIDLGSAQAVTCAIIDGHDWESGDNAPQIRKSNDNFAVDDNLVATFTHDVGTMIVWFASNSERYWRFALTKSGAAEIRNIGRLFIGTYWEPSKSQAVGWSRQQVDPSVVERSLSQTVYADTRAKWFRSNFSLVGLTASDITNFRLFAADVGRTKPFFLTLDQAGDPFELTHYGRLGDVPAEIEILPTPIYQVDIGFEEEPD
jgi:hypothetical protein